jgi:peptidoglycan/xylan/chitin deacetylase (PgdA/CDA1 family)
VLLMVGCAMFGSAFAAAPAARPDNKLPVLVYHEIRTSGETPVDSSTAISLARFESQMRYLHDAGYETLSMHDVAHFIREGRPAPAKLIAIHFDDGWQSVQAAIPVLNRYGFKATFWIIAGTGIGWPHMDWQMIGMLAENRQFDIYSHTMTHPWKNGETLHDYVEGRTAGKNAGSASWELAASKELLEEKLLRPVPYLAWPRGIYDTQLIEMARQAGYEALLTIDDGVNVQGSDPMRIRRTMIHGGCNDAVFIQLLQDGRYRDCP